MTSLEVSAPLYECPHAREAQTLSPPVQVHVGTALQSKLLFVSGRISSWQIPFTTLYISLCVCVKKICITSQNPQSS